ncbi:unnamed protein product [Lactuca saligna]|uniref:Uncharacterized protein n=1 Tax=Lactuca saligna TaxID=75948 RepID=A0AA36A123_LACSI|nr:unnamed protein product [Lactuca saligna]
MLQIAIYILLLGLLYQLKRLLEVVKENVPAAEHRQCARHICANFMKRFKGQRFRKLFWYVAASTTPAKFEHHMNEIKKLEPLAYDHLMEKGPKTWSKAFFRLIGLVLHMKMDLTICPTIRLKLSKLKDLQRFWKVIPSGYQQYEVKIRYDAYVADIGRRTCSYKTWQLTCYPCVHGYTINPLNGSYMWPHVDYINLLPPKRRRLPGIPSTKRKRDQIERENHGKKHTIIKRVKVALAHEFDIDSDSELEIEPESEVDSFDVEFEDDVQPEVHHEVQDRVQPEVQDQVQAEVQHEVQPQVHPEVQVQDANQVEVHPEVQPKVQVKVKDANQIVVQDQVEIPAFQVVVGQRARKPSKRITKLKIRKTWEGKQGSSDDNPYELD